MNTASWLVLSFVTGALLGAFYFAGLWLTVRRLPTITSPALWLVASFVIRTAVVLTGFFVVASGQWERVVATVVGFLVARAIVIHIFGKSDFMTPTENAQGLASVSSFTERSGNGHQ